MLSEAASVALPARRRNRASAPSMAESEPGNRRPKTSAGTCENKTSGGALPDVAPVRCTGDIASHA